MQLAIFQDPELRQLLRDCTIAEGGVIPAHVVGDDADGEVKKAKKGGKSGKGGKGGKSHDDSSQAY
jgi:hypothetical protein